MRLALLLLLAAGCDAVFGLRGSDLPRCELRAFDGAARETLTAADRFAMPADASYTLVERSGNQEELDPSGRGIVVDFGLPAPMASFAVTPAGDRALYSFALEPPVLRAAERTGRGAWVLGGPVPSGSYAGAPSALQRVLVVPAPNTHAVQEYELRDGAWHALGEPHPLVGQLAPNLAPDGLTMVYDGFDADGAHAVMAAQRDSVDDWFGAPVRLLPGIHRAPYLAADCRELYAIETNEEPSSNLDLEVLRRYGL